ncbi:outer membrane protein assembly factor BamB [Methylogaea oryzae]|uniref:Outer membrane protein assembly factor BamB n=1 Tax=Methylogaea oryzae TaxID=1295382 RepID=A0A8D4VSV1_9GAMM|nr:outer membrane protein assembly factor BamB [Methylogaea oryzae]BBL71952.1 outer membrane protein assembly factor BamB [Methylogaea oryzae]
MSRHALVPRIPVARALLRGALLASLLPLAGCAQLQAVNEGFNSLTEYITGKDNAAPPTPLQEIKEEVAVEVVWKDTVGEGYDGHSLNLIPALDGDRLYVASHDGHVEARDKNTGQVLWAVDTGYPFSGGIGVGPGHLLIGTDNADMVALSATDGALQWQATVSSEVLSIPKEDKGFVVIRCTDGRLYGLDAATGGRRWYFERPVPALSLRIMGGPAVAGGLVVDGYAGGKLVALKLEDGQVQWETMVAHPRGRSEIERLVDLGGEPAVQSDMLYLAGFNGGLAAVSMAGGEVQWRIETVSGDTGPVVSGRSLYLTDDDSDVWRFETNIGGDMWRQGDLHQRRLTVPAVFQNLVVVGDFEGYVHFLSQEDGHIMGRIQVGKEPFAPKLVADDAHVYAYSKDGTLAALRVH